MSVIALVAWTKHRGGGKGKKRGQIPRLPLGSLRSPISPPPFLPNAEPVPRLSFGVGGNIFKTEISLKEWTKGFEGWAAGKSGKIRYQLFFLGIIRRSQVAGHRSMCECILSPDR